MRVHDETAGRDEGTELLDCSTEYYLHKQGTDSGGRLNIV